MPAADASAHTSSIASEERPTTAAIVPWHFSPACCHELAPDPYEAQPVFERQSACGDECRIFAKRVSGHHGRQCSVGRVTFLDLREQYHTMEEYRRLRVPCLPELVFPGRESRSRSTVCQESGRHAPSLPVRCCRPHRYPAPCRHTGIPVPEKRKRAWPCLSPVLCGPFHEDCPHV